MPVVHSQTRIPCHHEHEPDSIIHVIFFGLPTFFMAEKTLNEMKRKLHAKIYHGKLELPASSSAAFRRNLEPQGRVWCGGLAPFQRIFRSPSCKLRPCQAALWPRSFCMDFARTFERSKSQLWGCRAAFWSEFRPEPGRKTYPRNETARDYTVT